MKVCPNLFLYECNRCYQKVCVYVGNSSVQLSHSFPAWLALQFKNGECSQIAMACKQTCYQFLYSSNVSCERGSCVFLSSSKWHYIFLFSIHITKTPLCLMSVGPCFSQPDTPMPTRHLPWHIRLQYPCISGFDGLWANTDLDTLQHRFEKVWDGKYIKGEMNKREKTGTKRGKYVAAHKSGGAKKENAWTERAEKKKWDQWDGKMARWRGKNTIRDRLIERSRRRRGK